MNPFHLRELNGELRQDWSPTAGLIQNLQPASVLGGPFEHRWVHGVCRVRGCGALAGTDAGCPAGVNMATLKTGTPLSTAYQAEQAVVALKAIWAAEKARTEAKV